MSTCPNTGKNPTRTAGSRRHSLRHAFLLFEALLALAIFSLAVLALGRCVEQALNAEMLKEEDAHARRLLLNRMTEIEAGEEQLGDKKTEELKGAYAGMKLTTNPVQLKAKNENDQDIVGIYDVTLELVWNSPGGPHSKALEFYVFPRQK